MLGVLLVELLQGWKWVQKPWVELFKLIVMTVVALCKLTKFLPLEFCDCLKLYFFVCSAGDTTLH